MIEPPSFSSGKAFCTVNSVPLTLMLNSLSKRSSVTAPKGTNSPTPALAKTMSIRAFTLETGGEAISRGIFGEIFFRNGRVPLDPVGPRHFFKAPRQFGIDDVPRLANLFVRRDVGARFVGIRDKGDIKLGMKSFSQRQ